MTADLPGRMVAEYQHTVTALGGYIDPDRVAWSWAAVAAEMTTDDAALGAAVRAIAAVNDQHRRDRTAARLAEVARQVEVDRLTEAMLAAT